MKIDVVRAQYYGGAVRVESSVEKVSSRSSIFDSNVAGANGGGVSISAASDVKITRLDSLNCVIWMMIDISTIFRNNEATDGGAVSVQLLSPMNELKCTDSSFDGNIAYGSGDYDSYHMLMLSIRHHHVDLKD